MLFEIVSKSLLILREGETAWNYAAHLRVDSLAYLEQAIKRVLMSETLYPRDTVRHLPRVLQLLQHYIDHYRKLCTYRVLCLGVKPFELILISGHGLPPVLGVVLYYLLQERLLISCL